MPNTLLDGRAAKVLAAANSAARLGHVPELTGDQLISILTACALDRTVRAQLIELIYSAADIATKSTEKPRRVVR